MEYVRKWRVGDKEFSDKDEAQRHEAAQLLMKFTDTPELMLGAADEIIAVLKPFATPRSRNSSKGNSRGKSRTQPQTAQTQSAT